MVGSAAKALASASDRLRAGGSACARAAAGALRPRMRVAANASPSRELARRWNLNDICLSKHGGSGARGLIAALCQAKTSRGILGGRSSPKIMPAAGGASFGVPSLISCDSHSCLPRIVRLPNKPPLNAVWGRELSFDNLGQASKVISCPVGLVGLSMSVGRLFFLVCEFLDWVVDLW